MSGKNTTTPAKQDGFKSQWGFIMAAVGSCVGMANVWRFPMLVSRYGGLTFLIPYFIFVIVISQSGMMEEFSLGRWAGYGPVGSFGKAMENGGKSKKAGELIGGVPVFASLCLGIGYSVIMGWVFYYAKMALTGPTHEDRVIRVKTGTRNRVRIHLLLVDNLPRLRAPHCHSPIHISRCHPLLICRNGKFQFLRFSGRW